MSILLGVLNEGLIYALMALGVYITYTILDFPDLSVDSTFPMGAAVTATLILAGLPPFLTLFIAFAAGALAGMVTGLIHVKLKVRDLLSGIIVMTALYSLNLRITGDKANLPIFSKDTIFDNEFVYGLPSPLGEFSTVIILLLIVVVVKVLLDMYMKTRSGYLLRAVGDNETLVTSLAKDKGSVKIIGLALANGLAALSGAVYCQQKGFFEISVGTGTIVMGLASVIIGTKVFARFGKLKATTAVILGTIVYKGCVSMAMALGLKTLYLKLITSIFFLVILVVSENGKKKVK
ncbi:ABC transporter permease [[Clostridium] symbiosum]|uniref:ABC transporter permease n=1 Tax=Clostridium symbiosum TaxID=1512 RepID=UPI001D090363|nr:ABC transporter permease [[Clostridium] symbiosum]MCB6611578.1 ABC transporter permease [[Clostridium] symbiosum]MCB6931644.1 ABC transporter permease [[Clostridium] symbiosum]